MSEESDFKVLGKFTQPKEVGGGITYICMINGVKWWVPDDMDNIDRQKVEQWIKDGGKVKDLKPEEAAKL